MAEFEGVVFDWSASKYPDLEMAIYCGCRLDQVAMLRCQQQQIKALPNILGVSKRHLKGVMKEILVMKYDPHGPAPKWESEGYVFEHFVIDPKSYFSSNVFILVISSEAMGRAPIEFWAPDKRRLLPKLLKVTRRFFKKYGTEIDSDQRK